MIGIYCWTNKINNKKYIGQSIDIERRRQQHIYSAGKYTTKISQALYKYGLHNFTFEIIETCSPEELDCREQYWIDYYDSITNGYNITYVDENGCNVQGENNPRTKLTNEEVLDIRNRVHINKEPLREVYSDYKDKISYDRIWSAAHGETWQNVDMSMIQPIEIDNRGSKNPRAILNEKEVLTIRNRVYLNNEETLEVYRDYKDIISYDNFKKVVTGETWTNVDRSMIKSRQVQREGKKKAKLTKENVQYIRYQYENGLKTLNELYKEFYFVTPDSIRRVVKYETWKNVEPVSTIPEA